MERVVLLLNHVISAEPQAMERLRAHAARTLRIELEGWPSLLPAPSPIAFRITAAGAGRVDRVARRPAARPARGDRRRQSGAGVRQVRRRRAAAAPGRGRRRLRDRRQLADREPALGSRRTTWRGWWAMRRRARSPASATRSPRRSARPRRRSTASPGAATAPARRRPPSRRPDEAPRPADLHLGHGLSLRSGRARAVELSPALGPRPGPRPHHRPDASRRRAASGCASGWRRSARSSSSSARSSRPGAT